MGGVKHHHLNIWQCYEKHKSMFAVVVRLRPVFHVVYQRGAILPSANNHRFSSILQ